MSSSERAKAKALQGIIDYIESDKVDVYDSYSNLLEVADMAEKALAASESTDLERLRQWATEQMSVYYGDPDAIRAYEHMVFHIADQIGGEAEDADRED